MHIGACLLLLVIVTYLFGTLLCDRMAWSHEGDRLYLRVRQCMLEMENGNVPPMLLPDAIQGAGCAVPIFYPPVSLLISCLVSWTVGDFLLGVNLTFFLSVLLSAWVCYWVAWRIAHDSVIAVASAVIYTTATYRFEDIYVRAALAECWSFVWFPIVFYGGWRLILRQGCAWYLPVAIGLLVATHTGVAMYFLTCFGIVISLILAGQCRGKALTQFGVLCALGLGLGAWYLVPQQAYLPLVWAGKPEFMLANIGHMHLQRVMFPQLLRSDPAQWFGYCRGAYDDEMSFEIGLGAWVVLAVVVAVLAVPRWRRLPLAPEANAAGWLLGASCVVLIIFMLHPVPFLLHLPRWFGYLQFPWRLLGVLAFFAAMLFAIFAPVLCQGANRRALLVCLACILVARVPDYQRAMQLRPNVETSWFTTSYMRSRGTRAFVDLAEYMPVCFPIDRVDSFKVSMPHGLHGAQVTGWVMTNLRQMSLAVEAKRSDVLVLPVTAYPFWRARDSQGTRLKTSNHDGMLSVEVMKGHTRVSVYRTLTTPFHLGYVLTLVSAVILLWWFLLRPLHRRALQQEQEEGLEEPALWLAESRLEEETAGVQQFGEG